MSELEDFRRRKDEFYGYDAHSSPLIPEQQRAFQGLRYYPENPSLRVSATLDRDVPHDVIEMDTSTGGAQSYTRAGKIAFQVDGEEAVLSLYSSGDSHSLFIPFRDATSGHEAYGAGRYLEVLVGPDDSVLVDFNYAYNPYCAYNEMWSCPIPPIENWLRVPIRAGEMAYEGEGSGH